METKAPFEKFSVIMRSVWCGFIVHTDNDKDDDDFAKDEQRRFIEAAILEKLKRSNGDLL